MTVLNKSQLVSVKRQWVIRNVFILSELIIFVFAMVTKINILIEYLLTGIIFYFSYTLIEGLLFKAIYVGRRYSTKFEFDDIMSYQKNKIGFPVFMLTNLAITGIFVYIIFFK